MDVAEEEKDEGNVQDDEEDVEEDEEEEDKNYPLAGQTDDYFRTEVVGLLQKISGFKDDFVSSMSLPIN